MLFSPFKLFRQLIGRKAIPLNRVNALLKLTYGGGVWAGALMKSRKRPTINRDGVLLLEAVGRLPNEISYSGFLNANHFC